MDFINEIILDHNLIMAIIAINMTIIGLTSLAETKRIIGVDYGKYLIKKFRIFNRVRIYELLIIFAIINASSLFLMFIQIENFRLINFVLLVISLSFAIYYFFAYIISENKYVKVQIYEDEVLGLYYASDNDKHHEVDVLTGMSKGSRTSKRLSSNVISYFDTYNNDSQLAFEEIFGPDSMLYDYSKRARRKLKRKYDISPYRYRNNDNRIGDISHEYFQLFRYSELQDKWSFEILRIFDGEWNLNKGHELIRLYNFTRVITYLNLFGHSPNIYKYKFLEHLISFYYRAVKIPNNRIINHQNLTKIKEVEVYLFKQLLQFMFDNENNQRDYVFNHKASQIIKDITLGGKYEGIFSQHELIMLFLEVTLEVDNQLMKDLFAEVLDGYYISMEDAIILIVLQKENIMEYIDEFRNGKENKMKVTSVELFG